MQEQRPVSIRAHFALTQAIKLRQELNLHNQSFVDIEHVVKSMGVQLMYNFDIKRPTTVKTKDGYFMLIPPSTSNEDDRWSICCQLGHIVLKHYEDYPVDRILGGIQISLLTDEENYFLGQEANIFASEFLVPRSLVVKLNIYPVTQQTVSKMVRKFGVSKDTMISVLDDLKLINKKDFLRRGICLIPPSRNAEE